MTPPFKGLGRLFSHDLRAPATQPPPEPPSAMAPVPAAVDASRDPLTGLYSASGIAVELARAIGDAAKSGEQIAAGYVGVDGLAEIHEEYGRLVSDQIVREIGRRLRVAVREVDKVGRVSVDEYLVVFRGIANKIEALALVSRLRLHLTEPIKAGRITYGPVPACGLAHYPADGTAVPALRAAAEKAMQAMMAAVREATAHKEREAAELALGECIAEGKGPEALSRQCEESVAQRGRDAGHTDLARAE